MFLRVFTSLYTKSSLSHTHTRTKKTHERRHIKIILFFDLISSSYLLCILTSFWVLCAPKSQSKHFFQLFFNLFCYTTNHQQQTEQRFVRIINHSSNVKLRPEQLVSTTAWGCPQDEGHPHGTIMLKMVISTSVWSAQHPNAGRNIQQLLPST